MTVINSITSQAITPTEQDLEKFTRCKLKTKDTRKDWIAGEQKELNQFYDLQIFGLGIEQPLKENVVTF